MYNKNLYCFASLRRRYPDQVLRVITFPLSLSDSSPSISDNYICSIVRDGEGGVNARFRKFVAIMQRRE